MTRILTLTLFSLIVAPQFVRADQNTTLVSEHSLGANNSTETLDREGSLVAVARRHDGCVLVDVTNPANPATVTTISPDPTTQDIWDVDLHNGHLYLMNRPEGTDTILGNWVGMYIYDVTVPSSPVFEGYILWGGGAWHHLGGSLSAGTVVDIGLQTVAFVCSDISGDVEVFDVTNQSAPVHLASIYRPESFATPYDVQVNNGYLYTAWGSGGFTIHDVALPAAPVLDVHQPNLGPPTINGGVRTIAVTPDGSRIITGEYTLEGAIRLWTPATLPVTQADDKWTLGTGALVWTVRASNDFVYVAHLEDGVQVLDIRGAGLNPVGSFDPDTGNPGVTWAGIADIEIDGNRIYCSHQNDGLYVFDFGDVVEITRAQWHSRKKELTVWATSSGQPSVNLEVDGFGAMVWNRKRQRYELKLRGVPSNPGGVIVYSDLVGFDASPVTTR